MGCDVGSFQGVLGTYMHTAFNIVFFKLYVFFRNTDVTLSDNNDMAIVQQILKHGYPHLPLQYQKPKLAV